MDRIAVALFFSQVGDLLELLSEPSEHGPGLCFAPCGGFSRSSGIRRLLLEDRHRIMPVAEAALRSAVSNLH